MSASLSRKLPWWTWLAPALVCQVGTQLSLDLETYAGGARLYLPLILGLGLVHWWGLRALPGIFLNGIISAGMQGWENPWWYPVLALPETLCAFLSWFLFTHLAKGRCWLPTLRDATLWLLTGVFAPLTIWAFYAETQASLVGGGELDQLWVETWTLWLTNLMAVLGLTTPLLVLATERVTEYGVTLIDPEDLIRPGGDIPAATTNVLELAFIWLAVAMLSQTLPVTDYWFLYAIPFMWAAIRFGAEIAALTNVWLFLWAFLIPVRFSAPAAIAWQVADNLLPVHMGLAAGFATSLITGVTVSNLRSEIALRIPVERARRESEERLNTLVSSIPMSVYRYQKADTWRVVFISNPILDICGYKPEELVGEPVHKISNLIHPEDAPRVTRDKQLAMEREQPYIVEYRIDHRDGRLRWVHERGRCSKDVEGNTTWLDGVIYDVTESKTRDQREQKRMRRVERHQAALLRLATHEATVVGDLQTLAPIVTETLAHALDVERVCVSSVDGDELVSEDTYTQATNTHKAGETFSIPEHPAYWRALQHARSLAVSDAWHDPRTSEFRETYLRPFGVSSLLDASIRVSGRVVGVICLESSGPRRHWLTEERILAGEVADLLAQVISNAERNRAVYDLEESEKKYRVLTENSPDIIVRFDHNARHTYANRAIETCTGRAPEAFIGKTHREMGFDEEQCVFWENKVKVLLESGEPIHVEYEQSTPGGKRRFDLQMIPEKGPDDEVQSALATSRDITNTVRLQQQLRQSQKMEAVGQLAGGVAHDFNNLLLAMRGYTELTLRELPEGHSLRSNLEQVERAAERAETLVRQLLTFSRKGHSEPRDTDFQEVVDGCLKMLERLIGEHIKIRVIHEPGETCVFADPGQIEQILMNLCLNARDALPNGGEIILETAAVVLDDQFCRMRPWARPGRFGLITIGDTGCGMPPEIMERIFEPFFTTKEAGRGTGLGLATVYGIVQQHKGLIDVVSEPERGTAFYVYIPLTEFAQEQGEDTASTDSTGVMASGTESILLAEDEELVRNLARAFLQRAGYDVVVAVDGEEAIAFFQAEPDRFQIGVLDVVMPGASGVKVAAAMRKHRANMPILFCSGYGSDHLGREFAPNEITDLVPKPFRPNFLLERVRSLIDASQKTITIEPGKEA